jgi:hypothetical protein
MTLMKLPIINQLIRMLPIAMLATMAPGTALGQLETAFTYQGRLFTTNGPATGQYDLVFSLYDIADEQVGASLTNLGVAVTDGYFVQTLDFGPDSFRRRFAPPRTWVGPGEWLEISVRTNKSKIYEILSPRQRITPTPYASSVSGVVPSSALAGTYSEKLTFSNLTNAFIGTYWGDGANLTNLNAGQITSGAIPDAQLSGNVALRSGGNTFTGNQVVSSGDMGLGTSTPVSKLDVRGTATLQMGGAVNHDNLRIKKEGAASGSNVEFVLSHRSDGAGLWLYGYNGSAYRNLQGWDYAGRVVRFPANGQDLFIDQGTGRVGVGTATPLQRLHVAGNARVAGSGTGTENPALYVTNSASGGIGIFSVTASTDANLVLANKAAGDLIKGFSGTTGGNMVFQVGNEGQVYCADELSCKSLMIRGGADFAEPFALSSKEAPAGAVMIIDSENPGHLKLSTTAYDSKVAGVVSGAGGIQPGVVLTQTGVLEGGRNVALTGRVYALVDADYCPVEPGDLLTTSATPGHAMKASDTIRRSGAVLGKAMTPLKEGRGLVLVLVSLQ